MSLIPFKIIFQCVSWRDKLEKERTRLGPKSDFFFDVRNWMCGVRACENMQKRVSHGETVRVGSSVAYTYDLAIFYFYNLMWLL